MIFITINYKTLFSEKLKASEVRKSVEIVDMEDLGMEAVRKIRVENMPAFIITDDKGNDFFDVYNK